VNVILGQQQNLGEASPFTGDVNDK